jgi:hypothetical protein
VSFYKALALAAALLGFTGTAAAESVSGAQLPDGAEKVGENRFRSRDDFEGTLKYYKSVYPTAAYPRKSIVNQPGVKAIHIANPSGKNWEGLNIYQANDEVRIYVVPAGDSKVAKAGKTGAEEKPAAKKKKKSE